MTTLVSARTVSAAWYQAVETVRHAPRQKLFHLVVAIEDPIAEVEAIRHQVDAILTRRQLQSIDTVANTILPERLAAASATHKELVRRYRQMYERVGRFPKNSWGTYFGRLVAYPQGTGNQIVYVDQLEKVINGLGSDRVIAAQYEMITAIAGGDELDLAPTANAIVHHPSRGRRGRGAPCLSYIAFQREDDRVHAAAHYRSQYIVERAYGNYLGLGRLLHYVAGRAGLAIGNLTVMAGYAQLDVPLRDIEPILARIHTEAPADV